MKKLMIICILIMLFLISSGFSGCFRKDIDDEQTKIRTFEYDGFLRTYRIHIPDGTDQFTALVLVLHGGGGTGEHTEEELTKTRFNTLSEQHGFIVVYPDGLEKRWNDGRTENNPIPDVDDVGFLRSLIDALTDEFFIDPEHVFVTGISNGGQMSYRLACEATHQITAIAPVVSALHVDLYQQCLPSEPIPVFLIAGTDDPLVPFEGGKITIFQQSYGTVVSMNDTVSYWTTHNNCSTMPVKTYLSDEDPTDGCRVVSYYYGNGTDGTAVLYYIIKGGGHTWPDGGKYLYESLVGKICYDFNACDHIWGFFQRYL